MYTANTLNLIQTGTAEPHTCRKWEPTDARIFSYDVKVRRASIRTDSGSWDKNSVG